MKKLVQLEEWALFAALVYLFSWFGISWWWFAALLFLPDISMAAYAAGPRAGAIVYNLFHHRGVAMVAVVIGYFLPSMELLLAGWTLLTHSTMDRAFGYGLKFSDHFKHTHLGWIGPEAGKQKS